MARDYNKDSDKRSKNSEDSEQTLICGRNAVTEALKSGRNIDLLFVNKNAGGSINRICARASEKGIPIKHGFKAGYPGEAGG